MLHVIRENFDLTQTKAATLVGIKEVEYILAENKANGTLPQVVASLLLARLEKVHPVYRRLKTLIRSVKKAGKLPQLIEMSEFDAWTIKQIERGLEKPTQELLTKLQKVVDNLNVTTQTIEKESKEMTKGQYIKRLRKALGMSVSLVSKQYGMSIYTIGSIEEGSIADERVQKLERSMQEDLLRIHNTFEHYDLLTQRKVLGLKQSALAAMLGVSTYTIYTAEKGNPSNVAGKMKGTLVNMYYQKYPKNQPHPLLAEEPNPVKVEVIEETKVSTDAQTVFDKITGTALTIRELSLALDKHRETLSQLTVEAGIELPEEHTTADLIKEALYQKFISENIKETV